MKRIGRLIFEKRFSFGDSQKDLAYSIGVNEYTVSNWENGKSVPSKEVLPKLALALETTVEVLEQAIEDEDKSEARESGDQVYL